MDRRRFLLTSLAGAVAAPVAAAVDAQEHKAGRVARVGLLFVSSREAAFKTLEAVRQGMRERGWVEGQNLLFEERWAEGKVERLATFAEDLVRLKVDVIVATTHQAALAAKNATIAIPIVMISFDDPVRTGLVASLARPGRNITGLTNADVEIVSKQLQMLSEIVPNLSRVAALKNPIDPITATWLNEAERAARSLRARVQGFEVRGPDDLEAAFAAMARKRVDALLVAMGGSGFLFRHRSRLTTLAAKHRLPTVFPFRAWVEAGGLMSYGPDPYDLQRRVGIYVDKILKGAKPGDLPIEQSTKFEFVINLKTAKALGLTIPPSLLARADQVIE
jgi:putative tryptophan/tyrosine transport system substrate-binding protein